MQQVVLSDGSPGLPSQLFCTPPDTQLLQETALSTPQYPAFAKDGSQRNLPATETTLMSQAQESVAFEDVAVDFTNGEW